MSDKEVLKELKSMGTAQNRKVYKRHCIDGPMYGVSYANLKALKKKIKVDHDLAVKLWESENHDARILATMVVDPGRINKALIDSWLKDLDNYAITDAFVGPVSRSRLARSCMERWIKARDEWKGAAGWSLVCDLAMQHNDIRDKEFEVYLETIEHDIHLQKNRVRYSMNNALIAIGARSKALEKKAVAAAKRIGKVEVDHGETGCKTPDAVSYIPKARARQAKRAAARR